jgi:C4-dicarboxylate-specific signal transduction histidine kinase
MPADAARIFCQACVMPRSNVLLEFAAPATRQRPPETDPCDLDRLSIVAASIAHEVNQPLSGILTNADTCLRMLCSDPPNIDGARDTARRTIRDVTRAVEVIARLRALFEQQTLASEVIDVNEMIDESLSLLRDELRARNATVRLEPGAQVPLIIGDRVQLQQVLLNLVRNATEAMAHLPGNRQVTVLTQGRTGGRVQIGVRDVGVGFAREDAESLFAPFYTTKSHGLGIGLSVSRSIVESHCGRLWGVRNDDGIGSTFWLSLPCNGGA